MSKQLEKFLKDCEKKKRKSETRPRIIFHIDVNNAFLSWTAIEMLNSGYDKDIRTIPSIIAGDESARKGIVLAKSPVAKELGIRTAEPIFSAVQKCKDLKIYPPDHDLYNLCSNKLYKLCLKYTDIVEQYSIDEMFLDVTRSLRKHTPLQLAKIIQKDILDSFGFTVNIGIANGRILAKTASDFEKPNKIHTLFYNEIPKKLWPLDISKLFTVGRQTNKKLHNLQIRTIKDLAFYDLKTLINKLGINGQKLWEYANGIDREPIKKTPDLIKSVSNSETFKHNTQSRKQIYSMLMHLCEKVTRRMREENLEGQTIVVSVRDQHFNNTKKSIGLKAPTNSTQEVYEEAKKLTTELFFDVIKQKPDIYMRQLSVSVSRIKKKDGQLSFFDLYDKKEKATIYNLHPENKINNKSKKQNKLDKTIDDINKKFGIGKIKRASNLKD